MKTNPPTPAEAPMIAKLARIGIVPGQDSDPSKPGELPRRKFVPMLRLYGPTERPPPVIDGSRKPAAISVAK
jgi:hypothetical protein